MAVKYCNQSVWQLVFRRSSPYGRQDSLVQFLVQFIRMWHRGKVHYIFLLCIETCLVGDLNSILCCTVMCTALMQIVADYRYNCNLHDLVLARLYLVDI